MEEKCAKCGAALEEGNKCTCDPTLCCKCCACPPDCTCGCKQKGGEGVVPEAGAEEKAAPEGEAPKEE